MTTMKRKRRKKRKKRVTNKYQLVISIKKTLMDFSRYYTGFKNVIVYTLLILLLPSDYKPKD